MANGIRKEEAEAARKQKEIGSNPSTLVQEAGNESKVEPVNKEQAGFRIDPSQGAPATGTPEPIDRREQARGSSTAQVGPDGLTYDVVATINGKPIYGRPIDPEGVAKRGEFRKGLSRGVEQLHGLAVGAQAGVADFIGNDEFAETRAQDYNRIMEEAQMFNPGEIHQIEDVETPGQFASWAAGILGEQVPNVAGYIVSGGIGGVLGKAAARKLISSRVAKLAQDKIGGFGTTGALAGGWTYGSGLGVGEVYGEQVGEVGLSPTEGTTKPGAAILGGMGIGTLDVLPVMKVAKQLGLGKQMRGEIIREIAKQSRVRRAFMSGAAVAGQEAGTEALQEVIGITARKFVDKNYDILGEEAASRVLNAAAAGGLVGGVMGGAGGVVEGQRARRIQGTLEEGVKEGGVKQGNTPPASEQVSPQSVPPTEQPVESGPEVTEVNTNPSGETTSQQGETFGAGEIVRGQFNLEQQKVGGEVDPGRNVGLRNDPSLPKNIQNLIEAFNKEVNKEGINFKRVQALQKKIEERYKELGSESPFPARETTEESFVDTQTAELPFEEESTTEEIVIEETPEQKIERVKERIHPGTFFTDEESGTEFYQTEDGGTLIEFSKMEDGFTSAIVVEGSVPALPYQDFGMEGPAGAGEAIKIPSFLSMGQFRDVLETASEAERLQGRAGFRPEDNVLTQQQIMGTMEELRKGIDDDFSARQANESAQAIEGMVNSWADYLGIPHVEIYQGGTGTAYGTYLKISYGGPRIKISEGVLRVLYPYRNKMAGDTDFVSDVAAARAMETVSHEFGHYVEDVLYNQADNQTKFSIEQAYQNFLSLSESSPSRLAMATRSAGVKQQFNLFASRQDTSEGDMQYALSQAEWFADQVSKYLLDKEVEGHSEVAKNFFEKVADALRTVYNFYLGTLSKERRKAAPAVEQWLNGVHDSVYREQQRQIEETETLQAQEEGWSEQRIVDEVAGEALSFEGLSPAQKERLVFLSNQVLEFGMEALTESQQTTLEKLQKKARVKKVTRKPTVREKEKLNKDDIIRMKEDVPGSGMSVEEVGLAIRPLLDSLPLAPNVKVVTKEDLRLDPTLHAKSNTSKGLFVVREGLSEVYLIADNIENGVDAQRVFLHEVVGHSGIRAIFTEQELERFLKLVRGKDETVSLEEAEERVARMAEKVSLQKDQLGVFRRVKALVRQALRKITGLALKLNDAEIEGILLNAASYLKGKKSATTPYSLWGPDDRKIVENEVQNSGTENYAKEKVRFIKVLEKGENLREATTRGKIQNKLRGLHLTNAERQAVETMLSRVPERYATWGRVIKDLEELFIPMRITKNLDSWNFKGSGMEGNLYFQDGSLIGMDVVQGDANYLANRMARESYRYAAQRRKNTFRYASKETVEHLGGDPSIYQKGAEFFENHLEGETVEREGEIYKESPVRFIDDNLPVPQNFDKQVELIRQSAIDLPQRNQLEDDTYWLLRVNSMGYMKFKQWMMTPLQIMKTTKGEVPETEQHVRNVESWYQTKIEIIDEAERILTGYTDENGVKHNGLRGRGKDSLARLGAALFEATYESDHAKGGVLTEDMKRQIFENNNLTEEEIQTFHEVDQAFKQVLHRIARGVFAGETRRWINDLVPNPQEFIDRFYNMENGTFNREDFIAEIERLRSANPSYENSILSARNAILESVKDFNKLSSRTYFPYKRFGKYGIKVQATRDFTDEDGNSWEKGQIVSFTTYDSKLVMEKDWKLNPEIRKYLKSENTFVKDTVLTDEARSYLEFPPGLWKYLEQDGNLNLTDGQRAELQNIYASFSPGKGFAKQLLKRKGVPGFSRDVLRVYSSYMFSAANHTARVEWKDALNESLEAINARNQQAESGTVPGMVYNYFQEHLDYIMNPKEEWSKLRAWGFLWYLGFNVKSAIVNLTQVPLVGYPWLAARFGDSNSVREIMNASKTVTKMLTGKKNHGLTKEEDKFLQAVKERGVVDQSQVSAMAEYTEGEALGRWTSSTGAGQAQETFFRAAGWLFHNAEIQNRRVMALASYRLQIQSGLDPVADFDKIVEGAVDAVQATQFEYSKWNRPKFMRGRTSVVFLFWQYMQQASFLAFGGEGKGTAARYWGMMLFAGGLLGLPFMDDLLDLIDFGGKTAKNVLGMEDTRTDSKQFIREMLAEHVDNPDLFMNGASRYYGLGPLHLLSLVGMPIPEVDISGSISMGDVLPLTDKLSGNREVDAAGLGRGVEDAAGAVFQIGYNTMKAVTSNDPDTWKTWERALPIAAKNVSKAIRIFNRGEETGSTGETFLSYEPNQADAPSRAELNGELVAQALGFASSRAGVKWEYAMAQMDAITWHQTRRSMLLDDMAWAKKWNDKEVLADVRKSIRRYNASVPNPNLKITNDTIRRSLRERKRRQELKERGLPAQNSYQGISRDIQQGFPEISFD